MIVDDVREAPNPQFTRSPRTDLPGAWRFAFDDGNVGLTERWFADPNKLGEQITVPYPPESELSGINDKSYHSISWYARDVTDPRQRDGERLLLNFGAVDYHAIVWVDGACVGEHTGGHTPFAFDISHALDTSRSQHTIVVRALDDPHDVEQPRGKQDWEESPHRIWYHRTSGIWQPAWLEIVPETRIANIKWTFDPARWRVDYDVTLSGVAPSGATLKVELEHDDRPLASVTQTISGTIATGQIGLRTGRHTPEPRTLVWSPQRPTLIGARLTLSAPGQPDDVVLTYIGLRTIELTPRKVLLNGSPIFMRLVLEQGYWPESQLAAPSPDALEREVDLIQELGFNGARIHQKVEDPRFLYWADRKGLLLWGEMANTFTYTDLAIARRQDEWREAVVRDRNHPSIVAWVPFNESWGVNELGRSPAQQHAVKAAYHQTHQLDGTRPVIGNDGWENVEGDIFAIHDYSWNADVLARRYDTSEGLHETVKTFFAGSRHLALGGLDYANKPVMVTEYGGVSFAPDSGEEWFGYGTVTNPDDFIEQYRALTGALHRSEILSGFCYTQLTDTEQETNGLLTDKREHKVDVNAIRKITSNEE